MQNSQENICARVSFFNKVAGWGLFGFINESDNNLNILQNHILLIFKLYIYQGKGEFQSFKFEWLNKKCHQSSETRKENCFCMWEEDHSV